MGSKSHEEQPPTLLSSHILLHVIGAHLEVSMDVRTHVVLSGRALRKHSYLKGSPINKIRNEKSLNPQGRHKTCHFTFPTNICQVSISHSLSSNLRSFKSKGLQFILLYFYYTTSTLDCIKLIQKRITQVHMSLEANQFLYQSISLAIMNIMTIMNHEFHDHKVKM